MWPEPFKQTFVLQSHGGSTWNMASFGPVVSEEKMVENVDNVWWMTDDVQWTTKACLYYKLTYEPSAQLS